MSKVLSRGNHRFKHGSIMEPLDDLMNGVVADVYYVDGPWGSGTLKAFETYAKKHGEEIIPIELAPFIERMFHVAHLYTRNMVFIEYGTKWRQQIIDAGVRSGLKYIGTSLCNYKSGSKILPHDVNIFCKGEPEIDLNRALGTHDIPDAAKLVEFNLSCLTGKVETVLDSCSGLGATAIACERLGLRSFNNELTFSRIEKAIAAVGKTARVK